MIRIVVYDDNKMRQNSLSTLFSLVSNMECVGCFDDCSKAKNDMEELMPDVVLMDIEMPKMDGIEGVKIIKQNFPDVKIIMQTVFEDNDKIFAALQAGAEGYILKNASINSITQCIDEVYAGGAFMTPSVAMKVMSFFQDKHTNTVEKTSPLSPKEKEVLKFLADGNSYKMIADKMGISYFTVNNHIKKVYEKLQVHSVGEALALAYKQKLL